MRSQTRGGLLGLYPIALVVAVVGIMTGNWGYVALAAAVAVAAFLMLRFSHFAERKTDEYVERQVQRNR